MVLHFQNAASVFDAFFLSIPIYWMKAKDCTYSRLAHAINVVVHGGAMCMGMQLHVHHTKSTPSRIVLHQRCFVQSAILCNLVCSYNPNLGNGMDLPRIVNPGKDTLARIVPHHKVLLTLPYFALPLWIKATTQFFFFFKFTLSLCVMYGKNGPKTPITIATFYAKFHLCGWP